MQSPRQFDVIGIGAVSVDELLYVGGYPAPDGKTRVLCRMRSGGGLAGTALVTVARLGLRCAYVGLLGDDELSHMALEAIREEGVDCRTVARRGEARPFHSTVIVSRDRHSRGIIFSDAGVREPDAADLPEAWLASSRVQFVDHTVPQAAIHVAAIGRRHGIPIVGDIEERDFPGMEGLLQSIDHLIVGLELAAALTGKKRPSACAEALRSRGIEAVVVTTGEKGCWYATRGGRSHFASCPPCASG